MSLRCCDVLLCAAVMLIAAIKSRIAKAKSQGA